MIDDLYVKFVLPKLPATGGPQPKLSDAEVLCLGLAAPVALGRPWKTERDFVCYALKYLRPFFPVGGRGCLWGAYTLIQQAIADQLWFGEDCEIMNCARCRWDHGAWLHYPSGLAGGHRPHWLDDYRTVVLTPPENERHSAHIGFSSLRQRIEMAFSHLCDNFGLHFPQTHATWGLLARIAAKVAAHNVDIVINRSVAAKTWLWARLSSEPRTRPLELHQVFRVPQPCW